MLLSPEGGRTSLFRQHPPVPNQGMNAGTFMLSLDCEGKWGMVDCLAPRHRELFTAANLQSTSRRMVSLLDEYEVDAPFAFTAAFALSKQRFRRMRPDLECVGGGAQEWIGRAITEIERDK